MSHRTGTDAVPTRCQPTVMQSCRASPHSPVHNQIALRVRWVGLQYVTGRRERLGGRLQCGPVCIGEKVSHRRALPNSQYLSLLRGRIAVCPGRAWLTIWLPRGGLPRYGWAVTHCALCSFRGRGLVLGRGELGGGGGGRVVRVQGVGGLGHVRRTRQAGEFVNLN